MIVLFGEIIAKGNQDGGSGFGLLVLLFLGWFIWNLFTGGSHKGKGKHKK